MWTAPSCWAMLIDMNTSCFTSSRLKNIATEQQCGARCQKLSYGCLFKLSYEGVPKNNRNVSVSINTLIQMFIPLFEAPFKLVFAKIVRLKSSFYLGNKNKSHWTRAGKYSELVFLLVKILPGGKTSRQNSANSGFKPRFCIS